MWIQYPTVTATTPLGNVRLAFTNGEHVSVTEGNRSANGDGALTYRGVAMIGHVHFYRSDDGSWAMRESARITRADSFAKPAPPTYAAKVVEAMLEAVLAYVEAHPDVLREAAYANASNDADRAAGEVAQLEAKLSEAREVLASAQARKEAAAPIT